MNISIYNDWQYYFLFGVRAKTGQRIVEHDYGFSYFLKSLYGLSKNYLITMNAPIT